MNHSKIIGHNLSGEPWIGLIDGGYAILITLLVINLPEQIKKILDSQLHSKNFASWTELSLIMLLLLGYFLAAALIYDVWSLQKNIFLHCKASELGAIITMLTIWLASLVPAITIMSLYYQKSVYTSESPLYTELLYMVIFRFLSICIFLFIYSILFLYTTKECLLRKVYTLKQRSILLEIRKLLHLRVIFTLLVCALFFTVGCIDEILLESHVIVHSACITAHALLLITTFVAPEHLKKIYIRSKKALQSTSQ